MHAFACKTDVLHITTSYAEIFPLRRHDSAGISFNSGDTMFRRVASHCATYYWDPRSKRSLRLEKFAKYLRRKLFIEHKRTRKHPPISSKTQTEEKDVDNTDRSRIFYLPTHANRHFEVMFAFSSFRQQMFSIRFPVSRSSKWLSRRCHTKPGAEKKFKLSRRLREVNYNVRTRDRATSFRKKKFYRMNTRRLADVHKEKTLICLYFPRIERMFVRYTRM